MRLCPQALSACLWYRDVKVYNDQWCTSSLKSSASLADQRGAGGKLQGWTALPRAFPGKCPLTFLTTAEHCQGQSHDQWCQQTPHVFLGCGSLPNLRTFQRFSKACFWAAVYILWSPGDIRALAFVPLSELQNKACPSSQEIFSPGSHFDINLRTYGISRRFYLRFWMRHLKKNNWIKKKSVLL